MPAFSLENRVTPLAISMTKLEGKGERIRL